MDKIMQGSVHKDTKDCLKKDFLAIAQKVLTKRKKPLSHLAFAKRTTNGYAFFESIHNSTVDILHEIAQKVSALHPQYEFAVVVEVCSELANMDEQELSSSELAI